MSLRPKRRAIIHDAPDHWVGWGRIMQLHDRATKLDQDLLRKSDRDLQRKQYSLYFVVLFETGGRLWEILSLRPEQIEYDDFVIKIERMVVLKRRERYTRNVFIKIEGNHLALPFIEHVEECDTKYLLPGYGIPFGREIDPESHISTTHVYNRICKIDPNIWPHWIRDQRSWHLSADEEDGGRGFDSYELREWYKWASMDMPAYYAGRRGEKDILDKLGIKDVGKNIGEEENDTPQIE